jgi:hypothetical protein
MLLQHLLSALNEWRRCNALLQERLLQERVALRQERAHSSMLQQHRTSSEASHCFRSIALLQEHRTAAGARASSSRAHDAVR